MKPASNHAPVFALDDSTDWDDLDNVMAASAEYQQKHHGRIIPLGSIQRVMRESIEAAAQYIRSHAGDIGVAAGLVQ